MPDAGQKRTGDLSGNGKARHVMRTRGLRRPILLLLTVCIYKHLGYCISEYKSDLEDKLQTYNKINGAIRRQFGKQMTEETKLRIHNMTTKSALKFVHLLFTLLCTRTSGPGLPTFNP
jgi:hypothetical protein